MNPETDSELNAEDFVAGRPVPYPADEKVTTSGIKPGHWFTAVQSLKSNNSDSRGELNSLSGMVPVVSEQGEKKESWSDSQALRTGSMSSRRPVVLPKGWTTGAATALETTSATTATAATAQACKTEFATETADSKELA